MQRAMTSWFATLVLAVLLIPGAQAAPRSPEVGRVIVAVGSFTASQPGGEVRTLARRSPVHVGDLLITGPDAQGQVRFSDGSLVSLRPSSQFRVDDFRFDGSDDGDENAAFTLLKGGMRTITGVIGKKNHDRYKVVTDVATIGVRGTHYVLQHCTGDCGAQGRGLYGGVVQGAIVVGNQQGQTQIGTDQFFHVAGANAAPQLLLAPPELLFSGESRDADQGDNDGDTQQGEGAGDQGSEEGGASEAQSGQAQGGGTQGGGTTQNTTAPPAGLPDSALPLSVDPVLTTDTRLVETTPTDETTYVPAPAGAVAGVNFITREGPGDFDAGGGAFRQGEGNDVGTTDLRLGTINGAANVLVLGQVYLPDRLEPEGIVKGCNPCTLVATQGTLTDVGGVGGAGMAINWGRWADGYAVSEDGVVASSVGSLHYIYSPNETPYGTVAEMEGTASYILVGGTAPTDELGNHGSLAAASIEVDFGAQVLTSASLSGNVGAKEFSVSMSETAVPLEALYKPDTQIEMMGVCTGGSCETAVVTSTELRGQMTVNFVGPNAERIMSTYGLEADHLTDSTSPVAISGTAALEKQPQAILGAH